MRLVAHVKGEKCVPNIVRLLWRLNLKGGGALGCALWVCGLLWGGKWIACLCWSSGNRLLLYRARSSVSWSCRSHPKPVQSTPYQAASLFTSTHATFVNFIQPDSQPICLRSVLVLWHLVLGLVTFCLSELDKHVATVTDIYLRR